MTNMLSNCAVAHGRMHVYTHACASVYTQASFDPRRARTDQADGALEGRAPPLLRQYLPAADGPPATSRRTPSDATRIHRKYPPVGYCLIRRQALLLLDNAVNAAAA